MLDRAEKRSLFRNAARQAAKSAQSFALASGKVYMTFLYYDKEHDGFELVAYVHKPPLYELQKEKGKGQGGFHYAYQVVDTKSKAVICADVTTSPWDPEVKAAAIAAGIESAVSVPIVLGRPCGPEEVLGVMNTFFGHKIVENSAETDRIITLCHLGGVATGALMARKKLLRQRTEKNAVVKEFLKGWELLTILPSKGINHGECEVLGFCRPCMNVGGDYYNYFPAKDGRLVVTLFDGRGKGPQGAMRAFIYHYALREVFAEINNLSQVAKQLQQRLSEHFDSTGIGTGFIGLLRENGELEYYTAAQGDVHVRRYGWGGSMPFEELDSGGGIWGMSVSGIGETRTVSLERGDIVAVFSDGFTDGYKGSFQYRVIDVEKSISSAPGRDLKKIINRVFVDMDNQMRNRIRMDDQAILVIRRKR